MAQDQMTVRVQCHRNNSIFLDIDSLHNLFQVLDLGTRDNSIDGGKRVLRLKMGQESAQWARKATEIRSERTIFEALESGSTLGVVAEGLQSIQGGTCIVAF